MVVGVAEDVRYRGWDKVTMDFYVPAKQNPFAAYIPYMDLVIRTQGDPLVLAIVALLATLLPAWRATRASPISVLRAE